MGKPYPSDTPGTKPLAGPTTGPPRILLRNCQPFKICIHQPSFRLRELPSDYRKASINGPLRFQQARPRNLRNKGPPKARSLLQKRLFGGPLLAFHSKLTFDLNQSAESRERSDQHYSKPPCPFFHRSALLWPTENALAASAGFAGRPQTRK